MNAAPSFSDIDRAFTEGRVRPVLLSGDEAYDLTPEAIAFKAQVAALDAIQQARATYAPNFRADISHSLKAQRERLERNWARKQRIAARAAAKGGE